MNNTYCNNIPYRLPSNPYLAIPKMADYIGIPRPVVSGDAQSLLRAMCATVLYRHLPQKERDEAMALIRQQDKVVAGRLVSVAVQSTFITPTWHPSTMTAEELESAIGAHDKFQRVTGFLGINPGAVGSSLYAWKLIKEAVSAANLAKLAASVAMFASGEFSNAELNEMREELQRRQEPANEHAKF